MSLDEKRRQLKDIIDSTEGKFFTTVGFTKRGFQEGVFEKRQMNLRTGVKKHLKGGKSTTAGKPDLVTAYDVHDGYRSIWLDGVVSITFQGKTVEFKDFPESPLFEGAML